MEIHELPQVRKRGKDATRRVTVRPFRVSARESVGAVGVGQIFENFFLKFGGAIEWRICGRILGVNP